MRAKGVIYELPWYNACNEILIVEIALFDFSDKILVINDLLKYFHAKNCIDLKSSSLNALLEKQSQMLSALQRIPNQFRKINDENNLAILELSDQILTLFVEHASERQTDLYSLLNFIDSTKLDAKFAHVIERLQANAVHEFVQRYTERLALESNPLALAISNEGAFDGSIQFAAFLTYLLEKGINVDEIISSSLLHQYFIFNCSHLSVVEKCYHLLGNATT